MNNPIYLDYASSTPVAPQVAKAMSEVMSSSNAFGNPASQHFFGHVASELIEDARTHVADLLNADQREIYWVSGASEANNTVLKGVVAQSGLKKPKIITSSIEHAAVLSPCRTLANRDVEVVFIDPEPSGSVDINKIQAAVDDNTVLVSLMQVNNETGVIQDIETLAERLSKNEVLVHVDAAQGAGKLPLDLSVTPIDFVSLSAHKLYGPKGIGALYVRSGQEKSITALIEGGGHEGNLRSGTVATHQCVGMGEAFRLAGLNLEQNQKRITELSDRLLDGLLALDGVHVHGDRQHCMPNILNFSFDGVDGESLMTELNHLAVSFGSACTAENVEPSHVLAAMGYSRDEISRSMRFSIGSVTTREEINLAIKHVDDALTRLRKRASLWGNR